MFSLSIKRYSLGESFGDFFCHSFSKNVRQKKFPTTQGFGSLMMNQITLHLSKDGLFRFYGVHHRFQSDSGIFLTAEQYFCISFQSFRKNVHPKNPGTALKNPKPSRKFSQASQERPHDFRTFCSASVFSRSMVCSHSLGRALRYLPEPESVCDNTPDYFFCPGIIPRENSPQQSRHDGICFLFLTAPEIQ